MKFTNIILISIALTSSVALAGPQKFFMNNYILRIIDDKDAETIEQANQKFDECKEKKKMFPQIEKCIGVILEQKKIEERIDRGKTSQQKNEEYLLQENNSQEDAEYAKSNIRFSKMTIASLQKEKDELDTQIQALINGGIPEDIIKMTKEIVGYEHKFKRASLIAHNSRVSDGVCFGISYAGVIFTLMGPEYERIFHELYRKMSNINGFRPQGTKEMQLLDAFVEIVYTVQRGQEPTDAGDAGFELDNVYEMSNIFRKELKDKQFYTGPESVRITKIDNNAIANIQLALKDLGDTKVLLVAVNEQHAAFLRVHQMPNKDKLYILRNPNDEDMGSSVRKVMDRDELAERLSQLAMQTYPPKNNKFLQITFRKFSLK